MTDEKIESFPDSPSVGGAIRVCGERGFTAFCVPCQDWEPIDIADIVHWIPDGTNKQRLGPTGKKVANCATCSTKFPPGPSYKKKQVEPPVPEALFKKDEETR